MTKETVLTQVANFQGKRIRRHWDEEKDKWYFSVIDVVEVLTGSSIPRRYWSDLKRKLESEGSQVYEKIVQQKFHKPKSLKPFRRTKRSHARAGPWPEMRERLLNPKAAGK